MSETQLQELYARHDPASEPPLRPDLLSSSIAAGRRRAGRRLALRAATGGVAAVAALAVVGGIMTGGTTGSPSGGVTGEQSRTSAGAVLGRISLAAAAEEPLKVSDDQFGYTRYSMEWDPPTGRGKKLAGTGESWVSVDGSRPGWHIGPDKFGNTRSEQTDANTEPGFDAPTYKFLSTLPTDPDELLDSVRAHVQTRTARRAADEGRIRRSVGLPIWSPTGKEDLTAPDRDQEAFDVLGRLTATLLPPDLRAAIYRAAAKIPGVTVVEDAVDASGRHGIGVMRESSRYGRSMTWIFDEESYRYLGFQIVDTRTGKVTLSLAVQSRAVVDEVRQVP